MDNIFKVILIGAGNIGSRHAQALMRLEKDIEIAVYDVSETSLGVCKGRIEEVSRGNFKTDATYVTNFDLLPKNVDLAIIATSSEHRLNALENLLKTSNCKAIILEKFLFPTKGEHERASALLQQHKNTLFYVNCIKRRFEAYQFVKEKLDALEGKLKISVKGNNWGLAGNGVHYIDLLYFISNSPIKSIELPVVSYTEIIESKRLGYIELLGKCIAIAENGAEALIECTPGDYDKIETHIEKNNKQFTIVEFGSTVEVIIDDVKTVFDYPFQSILTKQYAEELLTNGKISLTEYGVSADYHVKFLEATAKLMKTKNYSKEWKIT